MNWNPNENPNTLLMTALYNDSERGWVKSKIAIGSPAHKAIQGDPEHVELLEWYKAV